MTQRYENLPSTAAGLLQLARLKAGLSQGQLAERAGVPATMISAYERDRRQPTVETLLRLLRGAGFDLILHLAPHDPHDEVLEALEINRTAEQKERLDRQIERWREAGGVDVKVASLDDVIRSKEAAGRPKDLRVLPTLYRFRSSQNAE